MSSPSANFKSSSRQLNNSIFSNSNDTLSNIVIPTAHCNSGQPLKETYTVNSCMSGELGLIIIDSKDSRVHR